jgi:hypothetical protein
MMAADNGLTNQAIIDSPFRPTTAGRVATTLKDTFLPSRGSACCKGHLCTPCTILAARCAPFSTGLIRKKRKNDLATRPGMTLDRTCPHGAYPARLVTMTMTMTVTLTSTTMMMMIMTLMPRSSRAHSGRAVGHRGGDPEAQVLAVELEVVVVEDGLAHDEVTVVALGAATGGRTVGVMMIMMMTMMMMMVVDGDDYDDDDSNEDDDNDDDGNADDKSTDNSDPASLPMPPLALTCRP